MNLTTFKDLKASIFHTSFFPLKQIEINYYKK